VKKIVPNVLMLKHALFVPVLMFYKMVTVYQNAKKGMLIKTVFVLKNQKLKLDSTEILI
jgi:hypothetical protein